ncbi:7-deoxyloganetin glucosyltransferase-like [Papaver somniferum]|uniref:7-deoxyloganetin glucosyltransferase-like n=1 Tax=Papaver somniferum TaxID=3469 RepID=UPI000E6FB23A|nr:7-deoxyloganetin glucosyltransferase-like [Papaver somniferum]
MKKPHVVCFPYPAQGHVNPMMKVAKLLHFKGFHVTFVNSDFNHQRLLNSRGSDSLQGLQDFRFESIPDGLPPPEDVNATQDIPSLCISMRDTCYEPFKNLLNKLNDSGEVPPVSCIVADGSLSTFTLKVAKEFGIPEVVFWTISFCGFAGYFHYPHLVQKGLVPLKDESYLTNAGFLDTPMDWMTGIGDVIRFRDLPSFVRTTDPDEIMVNYAIGELAKVKDATALIFNTYDDLEKDALEAFRSQLSLPPMYSIGPLPLLLNQTNQNELQSVGSNLWKEEPECLKWLDMKEPGSVVYVNFGSITVITPQQMIEFAWGLANSKHTFLWVIRPDLVAGDSAMLPAEFLEDTKDRSLYASWCPQEDVLNHPSIGGFLTHSGWNSTLESICGGVHMICWPFFAEQQTNCRYSCAHWGIGMEIDNNVKRDEVEKLVRELMDGDKGKEMKIKVMEWKKKAEESTSVGGSSDSNLDNLVTALLSGSTIV